MGRLSEEQLETAQERAALFQKRLVRKAKSIDSRKASKN